MPSFGSLFAELETPAPRPRSFVETGTFNDAQRHAICLPLTSHAVVLAGAGTGKTSTLVARARWLVEQGVPPEDILLATFTKAAATEMLERLKTELGRRTPKRIGTLHALALSVTGGFAALGATLVDDEESKARLMELALANPESAAIAAEYTPAELLLSVNRLREERVTHHPLADMVERWQDWLRENNHVDFVMLLEALLTTTAPLPVFRHILVDEAQDLTAVQLAALDKLSSAKTTRYYVGDDDQSIYSFRGAFSGALGGLMSNGAETVRLEHNYRCGARILDWANCLIQHNLDRFAKRLIPAKGIDGEAKLTQLSGPAELLEHLETVVAAARVAGKRLAILSRIRSRLDALPDWPDVQKLSIHESKGLEWDWVVCIGWEEGTLPHRMAEKISEERRLAYVAVTRARERLEVCVLEHGRQRLRPSRFVAELTTPACADLSAADIGDVPW